MTVKELFKSQERVTSVDDDEELQRLRDELKTATAELGRLKAQEQKCRTIAEWGWWTDERGVRHYATEQDRVEASRAMGCEDGQLINPRTWRIPGRAAADARVADLSRQVSAREAEIRQAIQAQRRPGAQAKRKTVERALRDLEQAVEARIQYERETFELTGRQPKALNVWTETAHWLGCVRRKFDEPEPSD